MQEKKNSSVLKKKIFISGAVFFCVVFVIIGAISGSAQIKTFGAKFISIVGKSFSVQEKELGVIPLHEKTDVEEDREIAAPLSAHCTFETLESPRKTHAVINEVAWMGGVSGSDSEWIELKNISGSQMDLRGWEVLDRDEQIRIKIGDVDLPQNDFFLAARDVKEQNLIGDIRYEGALRNTNEGVRLFNNECGLEDEVIVTKWPAGDNKTKKTMERNNDGSGWHTSSLPGGTPGGENSKSQIPMPTGRQVNSKQTQNTNLPSVRENKTTEKIEDNKVIITSVATTTITNNSTSTPIVSTSSTAKVETAQHMGSAVLISEVCVGTEENAKYEFVELYNNSNSAVDLTGWVIKKKSSTGNETALVSASRLQGKTISPQSYFLIGNEVGYKGSPMPQATWAGSYTLAYSKNSVVLYKGSEKIDEANWEEISKGKSIKRISWGSSNFSVSQPTPGTEN